MRVTPEDIGAFQRDGAVCIRQLLSTDEIALLRAGIEANLQHLSPRAKVASRPDDPGYFVEDFCTWQDNEHYRRFVFESPAAAKGGNPASSGPPIRSVGAGTKGDGCEFKRGQVRWRLELSLGRGVEEA